MSEAEKEGFWARWSRRKLEPEAEAPTEPAADAPGAAEAEPAPPERAACPIPDLPAIDPESLPRIEELTSESDFALFLRPGVPPLLRNAALRRMWSLDPSIRDFIGPVEYQWDFNTPGGLPLGFADGLVGDLKKLLAQAIGERDPAEEPAPAEGDSPDPRAAPPEEAPPPVTAEAPPDPAPGPAAEPAPAVEAASPPPDPRPRRRHGGALPA